MTKNQLYYEDVEIGSEVLPLSKISTTRMAVQWAGATGDINPLHYDDTFAESQGTGGIITHGALKKAWLVNMITDWIGDEGWLKRFSCQYRGMDYPRRMLTMEDPVEGETWWCKGKVTGKRVEGDEHLVDCEIWVENGRGERTTPGNATVVLPSRGAGV